MKPLPGRQQIAPWQPTLLIRASMVFHLLAVIALIAAPGQWRWVSIAVIANHVLIALLGMWPRSPLLGPNLSRLPARATARNEIALTFDDGPDPIVTPQVLDLLDHYATRATFFCIGDKAESYPDLCNEIVQRGHAVENHSQHHWLYFALLGPAGLRRELQAAQDSILRITGQCPIFFRAPAGVRSPFLDPVLNQLGLRLASWSARGFDTHSRSARLVSKRLLRGLRAGSILMMHDGNAGHTQDGKLVVLEALHTVLNAAAAANLHFVTLRRALL